MAFKSRLAVRDVVFDVVLATYHFGFDLYLSLLIVIKHQDPVKVFVRHVVEECWIVHASSP